MGKKRLNKKKFISPIPVTLSSEVYGALPELYPHNPLSWVYFAFKYVYILSKPVPQATIPNIVVEYREGPLFAVRARKDIDLLWDRGFFGKGILSRSDATWESRTIRRLHLHLNEPFELSKEDITRFRREERTKFKLERAREHELELKRKKHTITSDETKELTAIKAMLMEFRQNNKLKVKEEQQQTIEYEDMRPEDQLLVDKNSLRLAANLEYVQLEPVEVLFLKWLDLVDVGMDLKQLFNVCCPSPEPNSSFLLQYVVYHYYRSLGWCVRSGIKFGCDYLLYKRGPPFSHAEHAIVILPTDGSMDKSTVELQSVSRVIGSVRKNLVLTYVQVPSNDQLMQALAGDIRLVVELYKVTEITYRRWVPNKTRD